MRPPRPELSNAVPPPIVTKEKRPRLLRAANALWLLGLLAGVGAIIVAVLDRESFLTALQDTALAVDSEGAEENAEQVALIAFWGTLGFYAAVVVITALLVLLLLGRRGWTRWALALVLLVNIGAVVLVQGILETDAGWLLPIPLLAVAQLFLAFFALGLSMLPRASRWFKQPRTVNSGA